MLNALSPTRRQRAQHMTLVQWAESRGLEFLARRNGSCGFVGEWSGQPVSIDLQPSGRPYFEGWEISARVEVGVQASAGMVLMNRPLKLTMERWADYVYAQITNVVQTMADTLPEEVRWLAAYRDAGWSGPAAEFFDRYAVLTDGLDETRQLIDQDTVDALMHWPEDVRSAQSPLLLMRLRSKLHLCLQLDADRHKPSELHALDLFERMARRLLAQARAVNSLA
ncbi:MAG: hypothetical protein KF871_10125 [Hydrogenophaga sp.]|uniref:hypothetical protein n=1 Tax=Hydrogenophaga sp. TaxID=1904254 RepID=UPI001DC6D4B3|nr:hypothetical protein [Hydrogenophaga sp.]MBX3610243.1 hypothetical protein [Hydrogenophaga sp.]